MEKQLILYLKSKKNYYNYLKENSFWIKDLNRNNNIKEFEEFIKNKYHLKATDRLSEAIDNIDLISNVLSAIK